MQHTPIEQHPGLQRGIAFENRIAVLLGRMKPEIGSLDITDLPGVQERESPSSRQVSGPGVLIPLRLIEVCKVKLVRLRPGSFGVIGPSFRVRAPACRGRREPGRSGQYLSATESVWRRMCHLDHFLVLSLLADCYPVEHPQGEPPRFR